MIRFLIFVSGLALSLFAFVGTVNGQAQPSFNCSTATSALDKLICNDTEIATADKTMSQLYPLTRTSAFGSGTSNQLMAQREWLKGRQGCMTLSPAPYKEGQVYGPRQCLANDYRRRNGELAVAILLNHPDIAMPVLRKNYPEMAPLYEALQLYLTKPAAKNWTDQQHRATKDRILALLTPYFADLKNDENKGYGFSVLSDIAATPADAMQSDAKMASTFGIVGVYVPNDDGSASVPFPCAAIIDRPAMISAAGPYFGSTLDNFLPQPDCEQTLPAQPRFDALVKALNSFWKGDCGGGTIRFAYYRAYSALQISAQAGLPVLAQKGEGNQLTRMGLRPQLVNAAIAELADQYQRYNGITKAEALKRARFWVGRIIADAGECES